MIITLTPNPSLDLLYSAERLVWDDANRIPMPRRRAGGQGINVVRAARVLGGDGHAIAPLGGPVGRDLTEMLEAEGTPLTAVPIAGDTRVFVGVRESDTHRSLLLNPRGPTATDEEGRAILDTVARVLEEEGRGAWFVACGSVLPGLPPDLYARVGRLARDAGARFIPDCDGEPLALALPQANLLVPNDMEAARLARRAVGDAGDAVDVGRLLLERGPDAVAITLGARGAVWVDGEGSWWARPVPPEGADALASGSAVGAGDAFLAALLLARDRGTSPGEALAAAVATGTATLLSEGTDLIRPGTVEDVRRWIQVEEL